MSRRSRCRASSTTTTSCSTGRRCSPRRRSPLRSGRASTMCWSTSIRTPTRLQSRVLLALKPEGRGLTVVGDDAQSIYSFRAATVRNILDFPGHLRAGGRDRDAGAELSLDPADPRRLERRHRPRRRALHQGFVDRTGVGREAATSPSSATRPRRRATSSRKCCGTARRGRGSRTRPCSSVPRITSGPLEVELTRRNIPIRQIWRAEVPRYRHVKICSRRCALPRIRATALAGFRILQAPARHRAGYRRRGARPRRDRAGRQRRAGAFRAARPCRRRLAGLRRLNAGTRRWPRRLARRNRGGPPLVRAPSRAHPRGRGDALRRHPATRGDASGYPSRERFLTELTLDPPDATSDQAGVPLLDEDYLILSTIHSAKGQEWKSVFVLRGIDGCIPLRPRHGTTEEIEEERRLLYVAMTRAKDQLDIVIPQRCYVLQQRRTATATSTRSGRGSFRKRSSIASRCGCGRRRKSPRRAGASIRASMSRPACGGCGGRVTDARSSRGR